MIDGEYISCCLRIMLELVKTGVSGLQDFYCYYLLTERQGDKEHLPVEFG